MKKLNHKQIAYSNKIVRSAINKIRLKFFLSVMFVMVFATAGTVLATNPDANVNDYVEVLGGSGTSYAVLAAMASIPKSEAKEANPQMKYRLFLLRYYDELDIDNYPYSSNITISSIPRKSGKFWHYIDCHENSIKFNAASEGDIAPNFAKEVTSIVTGLSDASLQFIDDNHGEKFIVGWEHCKTGKQFVTGDGCSGMMLTFTSLGNGEDYNGYALSFKTTSPQALKRYTGEFATQAPDVIAADATTIALSSNPGYQLSANTVATNITSFTNVTDDDIGRVLEIFGSGGTNASTIDDDDDFLLAAGATWTANLGSKLVLEIYKDGAATYKFIERSRIQT